MTPEHPIPPLADRIAAVIAERVPTKARSTYRRPTDPIDADVQKRRDEHCTRRLASQAGRAADGFFRDRGLSMPSIGKTIHSMATPADRRRWSSLKDLPPVSTAPAAALKVEHLDMSPAAVIARDQMMKRAIRSGIVVESFVMIARRAVQDAIQRGILRPAPQAPQQADGVDGDMDKSSSFERATSGHEAIAEQVG